MSDSENDNRPSTEETDQNKPQVDHDDPLSGATFDPPEEVVRYIVNPLGVEFKFRDVAELVVGAFVMAIPVSFTEEVWDMGEEIPMLNAMLISLMSMAFVTLFVYLKTYHTRLHENLKPFLRRVLATYLITLSVAAVLLALIQKLPMAEDPATAVKRIFLVALPAAFSATVVDSLK